VSEVSFLGSVIRLRVALGENTLSCDTFNDQRTPPPALGTRVRIAIAADSVLLLDR
jgi:putative spermidine/putrescine transport system ATP-binding protein